ncbi:MarR family transcriptional regulator [Streptomyces sp. NPDC029216]|uniref:MarR family winged helix-turn-helix transcriptional regulator n=1 Tax=Streptomyces sp. NPDC029216 TaxID=3154701 RepID=UPI0033D93984
MSKDEMRRGIAMQLRLLQQSFDAFDEAVAARLRLNRTDLRCLDLILGGGSMAAGELAAGLNLSPAATTTVIDRLERAGLALRERDPDNRRRVLVAPTDAARVIEREIYHPVGEAGLRALAGYSEPELATILDFLQTARQVQEEQAGRIGASGGAEG